MTPRVELGELAETEIAIEHVLWAASHGLSARELVRSIGIRWPDGRDPSWHDAVQALIWRRNRLATHKPVTPLRRVA
jgi:hypothetical protein